MSRPSAALLVSALVLQLALMGLWTTAQAVPVTITEAARVPDNPRSHYSRYVNFRPGDGEEVSLNPPRFSWPYSPDWPSRPEACVHNFTLQISTDERFETAVLHVRTPYNFYNTIPALPEGRRYFWRIGYDVGQPGQAWSEVRSFVVTPGALKWDRAALAKPDLARRGHPRILFNSPNLPAIQSLRDTDAGSKAAWQYMQRKADEVIRSSWWQNFPTTDRGQRPKERFYAIAHDLALVAFVWRISGDDKYAGVVERAVTLAGYPMGGRASPEGAGGDAAEDSTQTNEFLALLFDWLYEDLADEQRQVMINSLEWRVNYWMNSFSWRRKGPTVRPTSLSGCISSHQFEGSMDSAVMGLALYEHSTIGREWFDLMLNYLIGVTNGFGFDEAWNEGPGYGNSKMKWLMNATLYFDTALPDAHLGRNPYYRAVGDFFARLTPVGLPHSPWGNGSANRGYQRGGRLANFRKLAYLTGEGRFLANWQQSGGKDFATFRPFIEYVLPYYYSRPQPKLEDDLVHLFPIAGWVTASSHPPSSAEAFKEAVGIIFQSRPRGGYSHSFNSDNSFQIHAFGEQVNHGGGSTANQDAYAYHTMSHNTVLVDGLGQAQPSAGQLYPQYSRVVGFQRGKEYVYFAGDATRAYPRRPGKYARWGLPLSDIYQKRDCRHLDRFIRHVLFLRNRYFVIFDDLRGSSPARFTWLYHILPDDPFAFDPETFTIRYRVGDVNVFLVHTANRSNLELDDRRGLDGLTNPFTGEDYRQYRKGDILCGHNLWITNREPREKSHFLVVIYPFRQADSEPKIEALDEWAVRVDNDIIAFNAESARRYGAHFIVDTEAIAQTR